MNKASGDDRIPGKVFQILKDDALKHCIQYASKFGNLSSGHRTGKGQSPFQSQRKAMQAMLKLVHNCTHLTRQQSDAQNVEARLQQYMNCEFPDVQVGLA